MSTIFTGLLTLCTLAGTTTQPAVSLHRLQAPDGGSLNQASDLCYGRLGSREGLWIVSDRNGGPTAGRIYFIAERTLRAAEPDQAMRADDEFVVTAPVGAWSAFAETHAGAGEAVLEDIRRRLVADDERSDEPYLDLEAVAIAPSPTTPHEPRLFVVSEEPHSTLLELSLEERPACARLKAIHAYRESPDHHGMASNDGIEGLAWHRNFPGFFFAEEGTRDHLGREESLLFFADPVLGLAKLEAGRMRVQEELSSALTTSVRSLRSGASQTLNALAPLPDGRLLAVDRNGGWILRVDPARKQAERFLNLYDSAGANLRERLAQFPRERHLPYVSIEGIAVSPDGTIWLCDDPAIPEGWRESCLIRIGGLDSSAPAPTTTTSPN